MIIRPSLSCRHWWEFFLHRMPSWCHFTYQHCNVQEETSNVILVTVNATVTFNWQTSPDIMINPTWWPSKENMKSAFLYLSDLNRNYREFASSRGFLCVSQLVQSSKLQEFSQFDIGLIRHKTPIVCLSIRGWGVPQSLVPGIFFSLWSQVLWERVPQPVVPGPLLERIDRTAVTPLPWQGQVIPQCGLSC